ncbi:MAG: hypothetical protein EZS28_007747, partial [Streblomastix strix]
ICDDARVSDETAATNVLDQTESDHNIQLKKERTLQALVEILGEEGQPMAALSECGAQLEKEREVKENEGVDTGSLGGSLVVKVVGVRDVKSTDFDGKQDPYVKVNYAGKEEKTQKVRNQADADYNETFTFDIAPKEEGSLEANTNVVIEIWDYDTLSKDDIVGSITVPFENYKNVVTPLTLPVKSADDKEDQEAGKVILEIEWRTESDKTRNMVKSPLQVVLDEFNEVFNLQEHLMSMPELDKQDLTKVVIQRIGEASTLIAPPNPNQQFNLNDSSDSTRKVSLYPVNVTAGLINVASILSARPEGSGIAQLMTQTRLVQYLFAIMDAHPENTQIVKHGARTLRRMLQFRIAPSKGVNVQLSSTSSVYGGQMQASTPILATSAALAGQGKDIKDEISYYDGIKILINCATMHGEFFMNDPPNVGANGKLDDAYENERNHQTQLMMYVLRVLNIMAYELIYADKFYEVLFDGFNVEAGSQPPKVPFIQTLFGIVRHHQYIMPTLFSTTMFFLSNLAAMMPPTSLMGSFPSFSACMIDHVPNLMQLMRDAIATYVYDSPNLCTPVFIFVANICKETKARKDGVSSEVLLHELALSVALEYSKDKDKEKDKDKKDKSKQQQGPATTPIPGITPTGNLTPGPGNATTPQQQQQQQQVRKAVDYTDGIYVVQGALSVIAMLAPDEQVAVTLKLYGILQFIERVLDKEFANPTIASDGILLIKHLMYSDSVQRSIIEETHLPSTLLKICDEYGTLEEGRYTHLVKRAKDAFIALLHAGLNKKDKAMSEAVPRIVDMLQKQEDKDEQGSNASCEMLRVICLTDQGKKAIRDQSGEQRIAEELGKNSEKIKPLAKNAVDTAGAFTQAERSSGKLLAQYSTFQHLCTFLNTASKTTNGTLMPPKSQFDSEDGGNEGGGGGQGSGHPSASEFDIVQSIIRVMAPGRKCYGEVCQVKSHDLVDPNNPSKGYQDTCYLVVKVDQNLLIGASAGGSKKFEPAPLFARQEYLSCLRTLKIFTRYDDLSIQMLTAGVSTGILSLIQRICNEHDAVYVPNETTGVYTPPTYTEKDLDPRSPTPSPALMGQPNLSTSVWIDYPTTWVALRQCFVLFRLVMQYRGQFDRITSKDEKFVQIVVRVAKVALFKQEREFLFSQFYEDLNEKKRQQQQADKQSSGYTVQYEEYLEEEEYEEEQEYFVLEMVPHEVEEEIEEQEEYEEAEEVPEGQEPPEVPLMIQKTRTVKKKIKVTKEFQENVRHTRMVKRNRINTKTRVKLDDEFGTRVDKQDQKDPKDRIDNALGDIENEVLDEKMTYNDQEYVPDVFTVLGLCGGDEGGEEGKKAVGEKGGLDILLHSIELSTKLISQINGYKKLNSLRRISITPRKKKKQRPKEGGEEGEVEEYEVEFFDEETIISIAARSIAAVLEKNAANRVRFLKAGGVAVIIPALRLFSWKLTTHLKTLEQLIKLIAENGIIDKDIANEAAKCGAKHVVKRMLELLEPIDEQKDSEQIQDQKNKIRDCGERFLAVLEKIQ